MNFFKSILSDDPDPDPPIYEEPQESARKQSHETPEGDADVKPGHNERPDSAANGSDGGMWSFGDLFKTLSTRSESVLETYRKDLQEFGSGLKKETELFREVASRAVKDIDIDGVIKSTAEIISQGKDTLLASSDDVEPETPDTNRSFNTGRYNRFEIQLITIQNDPNTFCEEPEDVEEYKKWKSGFDLGEKGDEVDNLIEKNGSVEATYTRVVPNEVDHETFWCRYFYKVYKLKQQEIVRAKLVKRAISIDDDEVLPWDVDDDDEQETNSKAKVAEKGKEGFVTEGSVDALKKLTSDEKESVTATDSTNVANEVPPDKHEPSKQDSTNVAKEVSSDKSELSKQDSSNVAKEVPSDKSEPSKQDLTNVAKEVPPEKSEPCKQDSTDVAKEVPSDKSETGKQDSTSVVKQPTHNDKEQTFSTTSVDRKEENQSNANGAGKIHVVEPSGNSNDNKKKDAVVTSLGKKEGVVKDSGRKNDKNESGEDDTVSNVSSLKTGFDEDDLEWAEFEDIEGNDDKKASSLVASSNRADLRKRLIVEEDDEDLTWD